MTDRALLLVQHAELMTRRVGGLTVLERHAWTAARAGIKTLHVGLRKPADSFLSSLRLPEGLELLWSQHDGETARCEPPYLVLSGDHFLRVETLRHIAEASYPSAVSLEDAAGAPVVQVVPHRTDAVAAPLKQRLPAGASCLVTLPARRPAALRWLLGTAVKGQDGFMARNFDRHISLSVSRLVVETPITPNMMTVLSSAIGVYGASLFLEPSAAARMTGAALVWLHSVLDGCDGELARMRFQQSRLGAALDYWGDNLVHVALFGCMAVGFARASASSAPLIAGAMAVVGTIGSALLVDRARTTAGVQAIGSGAFSKLAQALAARDFIYLLLVLAYVDRTYEFLWASGVGSIGYFALLVSLGGDHEQRNAPHQPREGQAGDSPAGDGSGHQHVHSGR